MKLAFLVITTKRLFAKAIVVLEYPYALQPLWVQPVIFPEVFRTLAFLLAVPILVLARGTAKSL